MIRSVKQFLIIPRSVIQCYTLYQYVAAVTTRKIPETEGLLMDSQLLAMM